MESEIEARVRDWHERCFGADDGSMIPLTFRKLCEEVGELGAAIMDGSCLDVQVEAGDVAIVLLNLLRLATEQRGLQGPIVAALLKNESRLADLSAAHRERTPALPGHAAECEGGAGELSGEQP